MTRWRYLACAVIAVLAGCGTTARVPEDRFYQLEAVVPARALANPVLNGGLRVDRVLADPMRGGRAILYRDTARPLELKRYHYEFWVDEPPEMIRRALVRYLGNSGVADVVQDGNPRAATGYTLQSRLQRFEHLVGDPQPGFEVEIEMILYSEGADSVLWSKVYTARTDARDGDMHSVARAMQSAVDSIFHSMATDIRSIGASP